MVTLAKRALAKNLGELGAPQLVAVATISACDPWGGIVFYGTWDSSVGRGVSFEAGYFLGTFAFPRFSGNLFCR